MLVFRLISGCIRNGQFEGMFSSFEPFFIEFVGNDRFAVHFEQDVLSVVYLACSELSVALMVCTHWLQSGSVGLKVDAGVFPYPHSRSLNVFSPK